MTILKTDLIENLAIIRINLEGEKVNTLNQMFLDEIEAVMKRVNEDSSIKGALFISSKPDCFIAGADIKLLQETTSIEMGEKVSRMGQRALQTIENSKKPILAAIHGSCLGGGAEFALACHFRLATDHPKTVFSFPEILLGLFPGAGGTQRLPEKIGIQKSLDLMLTGKNVRAKQAKKICLIDELTRPEDFEATAIKTLKLLIEGKIKPVSKKSSILEVVLESNPIGRHVLFSKTRSVVKKKTRGLYPAPFALIDAVEAGVKGGHARGYLVETEGFGKLLQSNEAKSLISLFFANTKLKKNPFERPEKPDLQIGIIGAGQMGAGIGLVSLLNQKEVTLKDVSDESLNRGKKLIQDEIEKRAERQIISSEEKKKLLSKVHTQKDAQGFEKIDFVIEAVFEDTKLKHRVISEIEEKASSHCIIASNTSAIPIAEIAATSKRPENIIGMHYFSPVNKMPLLEVVRQPANTDAVVSRAVQLGLDQGKTVVVVKDSPGFYTTRVLAALLNESIVLLQEGVDLLEIDRAMKDFGFPVGPITLFDEVGIDTASHISDFFAERFNTNAPVPLLTALATSGLHGRKSGKGFFLYQTKKAKKEINPQAAEIISSHRNKKREVSRPEIQMRLASRFCNEALRCLEEGVLSSVVDGDLAAVFGLGFPPTLGGPFRHVDTLGLAQYQNELEKLQTICGERFQSPKILTLKISQNQKFHN